MGVSVSESVSDYYDCDGGVSERVSGVRLYFSLITQLVFTISAVKTIRK